MVDVGIVLAGGQNFRSQAWYCW